MAVIQCQMSGVSLIICNNITLKVKSKGKYRRTGPDGNYTQSQKPCVSPVTSKCIKIRIKCEIKWKISMYTTRWQLYTKSKALCKSNNEF